MKSISNSDFSLLVEKLPMVFRYAKGNIPPSDIKAVNALRVMIMLHKKLSKQNLIKPNKNDKE